MTGPFPNKITGCVTELSLLLCTFGRLFFSTCAICRILQHSNLPVAHSFLLVCLVAYFSLLVKSAAFCIILIYPSHILFCLYVLSHIFLCLCFPAHIRFFTLIKISHVIIWRFLPAKDPGLPKILVTTERVPPGPWLETVCTTPPEKE